MHVVYDAFRLGKEHYVLIALYELLWPDSKNLAIYSQPFAKLLLIDFLVL